VRPRRGEPVCLARLGSVSGRPQPYETVSGYTVLSAVLGALDGTEGAREALTERELKVLGLINRGNSNQGIAQALVIPLNTVRKRRQHPRKAGGAPHPG
jgi:DNA-binding NarL/FixJ family response regulator